jgi:hypothetical protein
MHCVNLMILPAVSFPSANPVIPGAAGAAGPALSK